MSQLDEFMYLPLGSISDSWGIGVSGVGHTRVEPDSPYPPGQHPDDHALVWNRGRVLNEYQLVYITQGQGEFESQLTGLHQVHPGNLLVLLPGMWHRYRPEPAIGWTESWIAMRGPALDRLRQDGLISEEDALLPIGVVPELVSLYQQALELARHMPHGLPGTLGTLGYHLLARALAVASQPDAEATDTDERIRQAQQLIGQRTEQSLEMNQLAQEIGMSYSHFRRAFRERTGLSPKQYHIQMRLRRAQELLTNTSLSIKEISEILRYDSPFHLSTDFKIRTGCTPSKWRQNHRQG